VTASRCAAALSVIEPAAIDPAQQSGCLQRTLEVWNLEPGSQQVLNLKISAVNDQRPSL